MDITFRTLGAWGAGKGANLEASEVDNNFWSLAEAIIALQNNPPEANGIASITVSGTQMTITLTDGTVMGPFTLPVLTFRWRGEYEAGLLYAVLDVFTVTTGNPWLADSSTARYGIYMVQIALSPAPMFDPDLMIDGQPAFLQLFGSVDTLLSTLGDVAVDEPPGSNPLIEGDVLRWSTAAVKWVNSYLGSMAVQDASNVNITGGHVGGLPAPLAPADAVTKAYVDALPAGMMVADRTMMANISGLTGPALANTLSDFLDYALLTTARGTMLYRGGSGWVALAPGTSGYFLKTLGTGADPAWAVGGSGVTSVAAGAGITTGGSPITATGSVALAAVADNSLLANITGSSAAPSPATLTAFLDHVASSTRGSILTRAGSGWVALAPGTSGYYLQTQGSTADAVWSSPSGSGTVTSISAGTGISTGGAPITGAGTVSLAAIATASVLANISGATAAPVPATVSVVFDSVFGSTQGAVVYRNATTWVMLPPGTSGQVLTTGGASANPAWASAAAGAPIANLLLLSNISGSTAAASGNSLSNIFDAILGSSRGMLVYRGSAGWAALSPGTSGDVLTTGGTAGDPHWAAAAAGGASISVGDTAPSSPSVGDAWWDSLGGQLYIRYNDGTSSQWVPASNQPGPQGPAGTSIPLPVTVANGGTGAATAAAALTSLGAAPIASPAFTGTPSLPTGTTAVTQAPGDADTSLATTAFVAASFATTAAMTAADNLRVLKAGDTITGTLAIAAATGPTTFILQNVTAGQAARTVYYDALNSKFEVGKNFDNSFAIYDVTHSQNAFYVAPSGLVQLGEDGVAGVAIGGGVDPGPSNLAVAGNIFLSTNGSQIYPSTGDLNFRSGVSGGPFSYFSMQGDGNYQLLSGHGIQPGGGSWVAPSSVELKTDVSDYGRGLAEVIRLNPIIYSYNGKGGMPTGQHYAGLAAEEVAPVMPEMIVPLTLGTAMGAAPASAGGTRDDDPPPIDTLGIDTGPLVMALINAVKELAAKVAALEGTAPAPAPAPARTSPSVFVRPDPLLDEDFVRAIRRGTAEPEPPAPAPRLTPLLIRAVQELSAKVAALEGKPA